MTRHRNIASPRSPLEVSGFQSCLSSEWVHNHKHTTVYSSAPKANGGQASPDKPTPRDFWVHTPRLSCSGQAMTVSNSRHLRRSESQGQRMGDGGGDEGGGVHPRCRTESLRENDRERRGMLSWRKRAGDWKAPGCASRLPGAGAHQASEGSGSQGVPRLLHQGWGGNGFVWQDKRQTGGHHRVENGETKDGQSKEDPACSRDTTALPPIRCSL